MVKRMDRRIDSFLEQVDLPLVHRVRQRFDQTHLPYPDQILRGQLKEQLPADLTGRKIAITCGSRGIDQYVRLISTVVDYLKTCGAQPFLVPAMGSHGGATAAGQTALLAHLGVTESSTGAPVCSSMETCRIGTTKNGVPVFADRQACLADGIILLNRIKPHTSFRGDFESGLLKMLAIGLGKHDGAEATHLLRYENMAENLVSVGTFALEHLPVLAGVATLENAYGQLAEVHVLRPDEIISREPGLLQRARDLMPRLYLDTIDVLIIREIGKQISGTGMDTNIVGRYHTQAASGGPRTIKLGVLDLSEQSDGNANGMGLADFITRRFADKIDWTATYLNTLTSTEPASARMPMVLDNDQAVMKACVKLCGQSSASQVRLVVIEHTKSLDQIWMSPAACASVNAPDHVQIESDPLPLQFDEEGCWLYD